MHMSGTSAATKRAWRLALAIVIGSTVTACTRDEEDSASTTALPASSPAATVATTAAPATTPPTMTPVTTPPVRTTAPANTAPAPPVTTLPPASTTPSAPAELTLLSDGIGPLRFGADEGDAMSVFSATLGGPASSTATSYPVPIDGMFATDEFGEERFAFTAGSSACFTNGLCAHFGGSVAGSLTFVGWSQAGEPGALATPAGITVGSRWSDYVASMTVGEGGCYSDGSGSTAGVYLYVRSEGTPFLSIADDGSEVIARPDPADVVVTALEAGDQPFFAFADC